MKHITSVPGKAFALPSWPESHTCDFLQENLPESVAELVDLIVKHVKALF